MTVVTGFILVFYIHGVYYAMHNACDGAYIQRTEDYIKPKNRMNCFLECH